MNRSHLSMATSKSDRVPSRAVRGRTYVAVLASLLWACGDDDPAEPDPEPEPDPNRVPSDIRTLEPNAFRLKVRADGGGQGDDGVESLRYRNVGTIYDLGLWIGATIEGQVHVSATSYFGSEFGPLRFPSSGDTAKVYLLLPGDEPGLADYDQWPVAHGAPQTATGEPHALGDATMFAVFDDRDPTLHERFRSPPMGAEVRQSAWGFSQPDSVLFVHYEVWNRSDQSWEDAYLGIWADVDVGAASNDRNACDVPRQLGITYTSPLFDEREIAFGEAQPALGIRLLATPNELGLAAFPMILDADTEPENAQEAYLLLQGLNVDGQPFFDDTSQSTTRHVLNGDPIAGTGWVETVSSDKRSLLSTGPLTVAPGAFVSLTIGIVIARSDESFDAFAQVREASDAMAAARHRWDIF